MKPHPRIRKTIKWGGAAVTVLLAGLLITSRWWNYDWSWGPLTAYSFSGSLGLNHRSSPGAGDSTYYGFSITPYLHRGIDWWSAPICGDYTLMNGLHRSTGWRLQVPTLLPFSMTFTVTMYCWLSEWFARRRARLNLCPKCNYDRAGIGAGAVCPECGDIPKIV
jgi:hypothetical protein